MDLETERKLKIWKQDENIGSGNGKDKEDLETGRRFKIWNGTGA